MSPRSEITTSLNHVRNKSFWIAAGGLLLSGVGFWSAPQRFFPAYLVAFQFCLSISLGCLAVAMIHHLSGGGWGYPIRRILEAGYSLIPGLAFLFLPLLFGMKILYPWAGSEGRHDEILRHKAFYLNIEAFNLRAGLYFIVWTILAFALNLSSRGSAPEQEPRRQRQLALWSGPGLVIWSLTATFSAIDWSMSIEPHWYSSIFGFLFMSGQGMAGLAFAIGAAILLHQEQPWRESLSTPRLHDLGNLLLAFTLFWSYISLMQLLVIWSGNLPEEVPWYLHRSTSGWQYIAIALILFQFLVPFFLLLLRQVKQDRQQLLKVIFLLLLMRLVDLNWLILPTFTSLTVHWVDVVVPVTLGALWIAAFTWRLDVRASLPVYEPPEEQEEPHAAAHHAAG